MAILNFDARNVVPDSGQMDAIPAAWYNAMIDQSEVKPTKNNDGAYLELRFSVADGPYAGRKVFSRLNIQNPNPVAAEIGYKQLSAVAHAVGVLLVQDSSQLHNIPLKIKVKLRKGGDQKDALGNVIGQYEDSNEIAAYKNINEQVTVASAAPAAPAFAPPPIGAPAAPAASFAPPGAAPFAAPAQPWAAPVAPAPVADAGAVAAGTAPGAPPPWAAQGAPAAGGVAAPVAPPVAAPVAPVAPPWAGGPAV